MIITGEKTRESCNSITDGIYTTFQHLENYISSRLDHYVIGEKEVEEKISWTERDIQEMHWNRMTTDEPVGIIEWEAYHNQTFISKVMNIWDEYTGLSYLSGKLETLSEKYEVRLYPSYTSKLLFKEDAGMSDKTIQIVSSLFGITHFSLITTLFLNKLFPGSEKKLINYLEIK